MTVNAAKPVVVQVGNLDSTRSNGVHRTLHRLSRHLVESGVAVVVMHPTRSARIPCRRTVDNITVVDIPVMGPHGAAGAHLQLPRRSGIAELKSFKTAAAVHLHSVHQPDHLWTWNLVDRMILTPHSGYHPLVQNGQRSVSKAIWRNLFDRHLMQRASTVQVLSQSEQQHVLSIAPNASVEELQFPIASNVTVGAATETGYRGGFTFIGRLDLTHKGLDILIAAWARTGRARRESVLTIAGPDEDSGRQRIIALAEQYGVSGSVKVVAEVHGEAKSRLLDETSWFVHSSRWEGLPVAPIEAMSRGIPVIVSRSTNLEPLVTPYRAGIVTNGTIASLSVAIDEAFEESFSSYRDRAEGCKALVKQNFTWPTLWPRYQSMYGIG